MLGSTETMSGCYEEFRRLPASSLRDFFRLRGKVRKLLGIVRR